MRCNGKEVRRERESLFMDQTVPSVYGKGLLLIRKCTFQPKSQQ